MLTLQKTATTAGKVPHKKARQKKEFEMSSDWFSRGVSGFREKQEEKKAQRAEREKFDMHRDLWTWYISQRDADEGVTKKVIFLTSLKNAISTYFHEIPKVPGNWKSGSFRVTCPKMLDPTGQTRCPLCEIKDEYPRLRTLLALVDVTGYTRDNKVIRPVKYLLASEATMETLIMDCDPEMSDDPNNTDILGAAYAVKRIPSKGSSQGDKWKRAKNFDLEEFAKTYNDSLLPTIQRFPEEWDMIANPDADPNDQKVILKDLPWEQIFAPMSPEALAELTGRPFKKVGESSQSASSSSAFSGGVNLDDAEFPDAPF